MKPNFRYSNNPECCENSYPQISISAPNLYTSNTKMCGFCRVNAAYPGHEYCSQMCSNYSKNQYQHQQISNNNSPSTNNFLSNNNNQYNFNNNNNQYNHNNNQYNYNNNNQYNHNIKDERKLCLVCNLNFAFPGFSYCSRMCANSIKNFSRNHQESTGPQENKSSEEKRCKSCNQVMQVKGYDFCSRYCFNLSNQNSASPQQDRNDNAKRIEEKKPSPPKKDEIQKKFVEEKDYMKISNLECKFKPNEKVIKEIEEAGFKRVDVINAMDTLFDEKKVIFFFFIRIFF